MQGKQSFHAFLNLTHICDQLSIYGNHTLGSKLQTWSDAGDETSRPRQWATLLLLQMPPKAAHSHMKVSDMFQLFWNFTYKQTLEYFFTSTHLTPLKHLKYSKQRETLGQAQMWRNWIGKFQKPRDSGPMLRRAALRPVLHYDRRLSSHCKIPSKTNWGQQVAG